MSASSACLSCGADVFGLNKLLRVELDPCGHVFCFHCIAEMEAARGLKQLNCCTCKSIVYKHKCWRMAPRQRTRSKPKPPEPPKKRPHLRSKKKWTRDVMDDNNNGSNEEGDRAFRDNHSIDILQ